jgi:adenosylmethionine-8-amino-7-oxononanoate aminotransferase
MREKLTICEKDKKWVWHPFTQMKTAGDALPIVRGEGTLLIDEDGSEYIDAIASWWVNLHGHGHPYFADKIASQMRRLEHIPFAGFTHEPAVDLCGRLSRRLPSNQAKFFFSGDGSSAVEIALKMSVQYWINVGEPRTKILALDGGYHGETFGAMSAGARSIFSAHFNEFLFDVIHLPFPENEEECLSALERELSEGGVAAFIFEPLVQGAGGMRMYSPAILDKLIARAKEEGVLCIADEVMTGFGRTGTYFACNQLTQQPDFMCLSKGLSGGIMPLSLTTCAQKIYDAFLGDDITTAFLHGHSFTGNPIGCVSAIASLDLLESEECWTNIKRIESRHAEFAAQLKAEFQDSDDHGVESGVEAVQSSAAEAGVVKGVIKDVRQKATILAIELKAAETGYASSIRAKLYDHFINKGVLLRPLGNVLYVLPPYCITDDELQKVYKSIESALEMIAK